MKYFVTFLFVLLTLLFELRVGMIQTDPLNSLDRALWSLGLKDIAVRNIFKRTSIIFKSESFEVDSKKTNELVNELIDVDPFLRTYEQSILLKQLDFILKNKASGYRYYFSNIDDPIFFTNMYYITRELEKKSSLTNDEKEMLVITYLNYVSFDYFYLYKAKLLLNELSKKDLWALYYAIDNQWLLAKDILIKLVNEKGGYNYLFLSSIARKIKDPLLEIEFLKKALNQIPISNFAIKKLNDVFTFDLGNETELIAILKSEYKKNNGNFWLTYVLADTSYRSKNFSEALAFLDEFTNEKNPLFLKAQTLKMSIWVEEGKFTDAYDLGLKYIEKNRNNAELLKQLGFAAIGLKNYQEGVKYLEEYVFIEPKDFQVQLTLFQNYFYHLNKFFQAEQKLKECEILNPNSPLLAKIKNDYELTKKRLNLK